VEESSYYWIAGAVFVLSMIVRQRLDSTYRRWSAVRNGANVTGAQTAQLILEANQMHRVRIGPIQGKLTDHYNPRTKEIRLSEAVYARPSVAAMAISAHESGHAMQDAADYAPLELRSRLAPVAAAGARFGLPAAILGSVLGMSLLVQVGVLGYAGALLLQFLTLPVEFNASKIALQQLERLGLLGDKEREGARAMLRSAALTYVAGVASAAGYIIYLAVLGGRWIFRRPSVEAPPFKPPPAV
jgi:Zn-dependent membrane protease YugP